MSQAGGHLRDPARRGRTGGAGCDALRHADPQERRGAGLRLRQGAGAVEGQPGLLRAIRQCPGELGPAQGARGGDRLSTMPSLAAARPGASGASRPSWRWSARSPNGRVWSKSPRAATSRTGWPSTSTNWPRTSTDCGTGAMTTTALRFIQDDTGHIAGENRPRAGRGRCHFRRSWYPWRHSGRGNALTTGAAARVNRQDKPGGDKPGQWGRAWQTWTTGICEGMAPASPSGGTGPVVHQRGGGGHLGRAGDRGGRLGLQAGRARRDGHSGGARAGRPDADRPAGSGRRDCRESPGLSVNEVAAEGAAADLPEQMVLAPRPDRPDGGRPARSRPRGDRRGARNDDTRLAGSRYARACRRSPGRSGSARPRPRRVDRDRKPRPGRGDDAGRCRARV